MKAHADLLAKSLTHSLSSGELTELLLLINWDWPKKVDRYRMAALLSQIACTADYLPHSLSELPNKLPLPPPFHVRSNAPLLIASLRRLQTSRERKEQLKNYLKEHEEEVVQEILRKGPENAIFIDAPELVSHSNILQAVWRRVLRRLQAREEIKS